MMDQPMYTPCAEWAEKLAATHLYDLSPSDRAALDMHIASCPACATVRAEYQAIDALILDSSGVEPLPDLPIRLLHPRKMLVRLNGSFAPVPMSSLAALTVGETASDEVDREVSLPEPDFAEEPAMEDHDLAFRHRKQNYPRENFCDMDKCPTCGAGVRPEDNFCLTCGNRLFPVASFAQQPPSTIDGATVPAQDWPAPNAPTPVYGGWSDVSEKTIAATGSSSELPTPRADASVIAAQPMPEKIEHPAHFVIRAPNGDILQDYLLEKPDVVIGRVVECDINFPNDMLVSRKHATVHYEDSHYVLRDQGSANGTLVNNQQLVSMTNWTLQDGDTILIGDHELTFKASTPMVSGSDQIRWKTASLYFRQVSFFADLPDEDIRALMAVARKRTFRAGEIIFHRDDVGQVLYVIKGGKVNICRISPEGQEISLVVLGKGDCFGELAILDGLPRSADAIALERVECYTLQRSDFYNAIMKNPKIATQVLEVLSSRLRKTDDLVEDLVVLDVYGRVAKKLLDLAHEHGVEVENGIRIDMRLTQQDLASMVGASRESVNKVLVYFTDKGYISSDKHKIALHRIEELKRRIYKE